jgi:dolichol-phosphate mannosyltransferase
MELTVVTPTFNESPNLLPLVSAISQVLSGVEHEIIVVDDDSPDQTWRVAEQLSAKFPSLRLLRRMGRRGLAGAVVEGFETAHGEAVACLDADLQHDPAILPRMLAALRDGADLAVGCRYMPGGGTTEWNWLRRLESRLATRMAQAYLGVRLRDPMSGYFLMWRKDFLRIREQLSAQGFKILIEIVARLRPEHMVEVPYTFGPRIAGSSKLTATVALDYLAQLRRLRATALPSRPPSTRSLM